MNIYVVEYKFAGFDDVATKSVVAAESEERAKELALEPGMVGVKVILVDQETPEGILVFDGI